MKKNKNPAAVALGALGGKSTSEAKRRAARENGRKHVGKRKLDTEASTSPSV